MLKCRFLKKHPNAKIPQKANDKAIGYDLFPIEDFEIGINEVKLITTGLVAIPPLGHHFELVLRSSTPLRYPGLILANHIGIIDSNYVGENDEIKMALCNLGKETFSWFLDGGKSLAQLILRENCLSESEEISLEEHRKLFGKKSRGGFGSTDKDK